VSKETQYRLKKRSTKLVHIAQVTSLTVAKEQLSHDSMHQAGTHRILQDKASF